jgi:NifU-like protein involved in Fe-S cluster formation
MSTRLYTPAVLALATGLAAYPLDDDLPLKAEARSRTCGSVVALGLALAADGSIARIGMQVRACAIGQASAALLAQDAQGRSPAALAATLAALESWLAGAGALPDWPGLDLLAPARDHPARHAALLLPWTAARKALSSGVTAG